jgi:enoyl-CoA hydratase
MQNRVSYALQDSIATITLDDGKMNALSREMLAEINSALDRAKADHAVVVIAGRPGVFSAGFDLNTLRNGGSGAIEMFLMGFELSEKILSFPAPVIVACTGHALAMGAFLVLSGDYRIGAAGAYKIGANEVAIGLTMPHYGCEVCRQRLSPAHFHRAVINAEIFRPEDAVTAGFLDRTAPPAELESVARGVASDLAKLDLDTHTATKLRARAPALKAIRTAIEADGVEFRSRAPHTS